MTKPVKELGNYAGVKIRKNTANYLKKIAALEDMTVIDIIEEQLRPYLKRMAKKYPTLNIKSE